MADAEDPARYGVTNAQKKRIAEQRSQRYGPRKCVINGPLQRFKTLGIRAGVRRCQVGRALEPVIRPIASDSDFATPTLPPLRYSIRPLGDSKHAYLTIRLENG